MPTGSGRALSALTNESPANSIFKRNVDASRCLRPHNCTNDFFTPLLRHVNIVQMRHRINLPIY